MARESAPAFLIYPAAFLTDWRAAKMDNRELGMYIRLLFYQWLEQGLPTDAGELAALAKESPAAFAKLWIVVGTCFVLEDGQYKNPRLERERLEQRRRESRSHAIRQYRAAAGRLGAAARWKKAIVLAAISLAGSLLL